MRHRPTPPPGRPTTVSSRAAARGSEPVMPANVKAPKFRADRKNLAGPIVAVIFLQ
jgi:hypothetical protein